MLQTMTHIWVVSTHLYGLLCVGVGEGSGTGQSACTDPTGVKRAVGREWEGEAVRRRATEKI